MRELTAKELDFITNCPKVISEEVVRPSKSNKKYSTNDKFADISYELNSYSISKDQILREIHNIAYIWGNDESKELINEVITSYCPVRMPNHDISLLFLI